MKRLLLTLAVGAALAPGLLSIPAQAADGDACATTGRQGRHGWEVKCNLLCDSKTSADTVCSNFTIDDAADTYAIEIAADDGCSGAATVDVDTLGLSTTDEHDLTSLTRGATTEVVIDGAAAHPLTILDLDLSNMTDCTDFDVKIWRFWKRSED